MRRPNRNSQPATVLRHLRAATAATALLAALGAHAEEIKIGGTGGALGTMNVLAEAYAKSHPKNKIVVLPSIGSGGAIKAVIAGAIQLGVSARPLSESEVKAGAAETEYGRTPFVLATPVANKTVGVTTQNLADFYSGKLEQWPDGSKVRLVLRPIGDSDGEVLRSISPAMREAKLAAEARKGMNFAVTDQDAADNIEKVPGALGPTTLALILAEKRQIKALKLDGVTPDVKSLADGSYPLSKTYVFVTGPKTPPAAHEFVAFVRSAPGRAILLQTGHWVK